MMHEIKARIGQVAGWIRLPVINPNELKMILSFEFQSEANRKKFLPM